MLRSRVARLPASRAQRGLSLVELMVGVAVGLFVVAAATMLVTTQLNDNRRLLLETQVQQDLRATADIITRQIRRAAHWDKAHLSVAQPDVPAAVNPLAMVAPDAAPSAQVEFFYDSPTGEVGPFGFRRNGDLIQSRIGGGWQDLTDRRTLKITSFNVNPVNGPALALTCDKLCADGTKDCWPRLTVRALEVELEGQAASDPSVRRSLTTFVRLRNDWIPSLACPA